MKSPTVSVSSAEEIISKSPSLHTKQFSSFALSAASAMAMAGQRSREPCTPYLQLIQIRRWQAGSLVLSVWSLYLYAGYCQAARLFNMKLRAVSSLRLRLRVL